jgi:hypothetical protein
MQTLLRVLLLVCVAVFGHSASIAQNDDDAVVAVDSSIVVLNASISDPVGKPVLGLKQSQFRVFEDERNRRSASSRLKRRHSPPSY